MTPRIGEIRGPRQCHEAAGAGLAGLREAIAGTVFAGVAYSFGL
jgi:hypothetical protein